MKLDGPKKKVTKDTGIMVTIMPTDKTKINKRLIPMNRKHQIDKEDKVKLTGKITAEAENIGTRKALSLFITEEKDIRPLLGNNLLREFIRTILSFEQVTNKTNEAQKNNIIAFF